jgi:2-polyprenyl-3-methyl-5-hydroxy-6-metoxy-1,4-benzoquinol methylase
MSNTAKKTTEYWDTLEHEQHMQHEHEPAWKAMIALVEEDLSNMNVLDFGCNQGGFLRRLYQMKTYKRALGVDIAEKSVEEANSLKGDTPCSYATSDVLASKAGQFDVAFSHEVVYLLPDLDAHAKEIRSLLKPKGVYYLATGTYTEHPLWERWRDTVRAFSPVPPQDYSLQDMARAFQTNGFSVGVQKMVCTGFYNYDALDDRYLKSPAELVDFLTNRMILFRMTVA